MIKQELSNFLEEVQKRKESYRTRYEDELEEQLEKLDKARRKFCQIQEAVGDEQKRAKEFDSLWHLDKVRRVKVYSDRIVVYTDPLYITGYVMRFRIGRFKITVYKNGRLKVRCISWNLRSLFGLDHPHVRHGNVCLGNALGDINNFIIRKENALLISTVVAFLETGYSGGYGYYFVSLWWVPWRPIGWVSSLVISPVINFLIKKLFITKKMLERNKAKYQQYFQVANTDELYGRLTREFEKTDEVFRQFISSYRSRRSVDPADLNAVYGGLKKLEEAGWKINISSQLDATTPSLEMETSNQKRAIGRFRIVFDQGDDLRVVPIDGQSHPYIFNNQLFMRKDVYVSVAKLISANRYDQALQLIKDYLCYYDTEQALHPINN